MELINGIRMYGMMTTPPQLNMFFVLGKFSKQGRTWNREGYGRTIREFFQIHVF
jgi:hypothetical protein